MYSYEYVKMPFLGLALKCLGNTSKISSVANKGGLRAVRAYPNELKLIGLLV